MSTGMTSIAGDAHGEDDDHDDISVVVSVVLSAGMAIEMQEKNNGQGDGEYNDDEIFSLQGFH